MLYSQQAVILAAEVQRVQHLLMVARLDQRDCLAYWRQATNPVKVARFARKLEDLQNTVEALEKEFSSAMSSLSRENMRACRAGESFTPA